MLTGESSGQAGMKDARAGPGLHPAAGSFDSTHHSQRPELTSVLGRGRERPSRASLWLDLARRRPLTLPGMPLHEPTAVPFG